LKFDFDFVGIQQYFRIVGKFGIIPYLWAADDKHHKEHALLTETNWEVYPEGIFKAVKQFTKYPVKKIYITETGAAFKDIAEGDAVHDKLRVDYFRDYLTNVLRAKKEEDRLSGFFAWTLTDNWEWAEGFRTRFGLVYNDSFTQQRIIKDSGLWFKDFLSK